jgi:hypothetical protein
MASADQLVPIKQKVAAGGISWRRRLWSAATIVTRMANRRCRDPRFQCKKPTQRRHEAAPNDPARMGKRLSKGTDGRGLARTGAQTDHPAAAKIGNPIGDQPLGQAGSGRSFGRRPTVDDDPLDDCATLRGCQCTGLR